MTGLEFGRVELPEGWVVNCSINLVGPVDTRMPPAKDGKKAEQPLYPNVNVTIAEVADPAVTAVALRDGQFAKLEGKLPKLRLLGRGELARQGREALPYLEYSFVPDPRLEVRQVQAIERIGVHVVYLTATAPMATFDAYWGGLRDVMCSFRHPLAM